MAQKKTWNKVLNFLGFVGDVEDDEDLQEPASAQPKRQPAPEAYGSPNPRDARYANPKVVQYPGTSNAAPTSEIRHRTVIYDVTSIDHATQVIDDLLVGRSVIMNFEDMPPEDARRVLDMIYGAGYAVMATVKRVAQGTYIIAPMGVEVAGVGDDKNRHRSTYAAQR